MLGFGVRVRSKTARKVRRADYTLFLTVWGIVTGSAVFLRAVRMVEVVKPFWVEPQSHDEPFTITDFRMEVDWQNCEFAQKGSGPNFCGSTNPLVEIKASIAEVTGMFEALFLVVYYSADFMTWHQGNTVMLPRDMFHNKTMNETIANSTDFEIYYLPNLEVETASCLGLPGFQYIVGCVHQGIPLKGDAVFGERPVCNTPPCVSGDIGGPPFISCLALDAQCGPTCGTHAEEVTTKVLDGKARCSAPEGGTVDLEEIREYYRFPEMTWIFLLFMIVFCAGKIYDFIMYVPGAGVNHMPQPSWENLMDAFSEVAGVRLRVHSKVAYPAGIQAGDSASVLRRERAPSWIPGGAGQPIDRTITLRSEVGANVMPVGFTPGSAPQSMHDVRKAKSAAGSRLPSFAEESSGTKQSEGRATPKSAEESSAESSNKGPLSRLAAKGGGCGTGEQETLLVPGEESAEATPIMRSYGANRLPPAPSESGGSSQSRPAPSVSSVPRHLMAMQRRRSSMTMRAGPTVGPSGLTRRGSVEGVGRMVRRGSLASVVQRDAHGSGRLMPGLPINRFDMEDQMYEIAQHGLAAPSRTDLQRAKSSRAAGLGLAEPSVPGTPSSRTVRGPAALQRCTEMSCESSCSEADFRPGPPAAMKTRASSGVRSTKSASTWGRKAATCGVNDAWARRSIVADPEEASQHKPAPPKPSATGFVAVMFSISAGESANIVVRNLIGKAAANLKLTSELSQRPIKLDWQVIDGFADEGHRIGAYYLMRAVSIVFYEALNPAAALKLARRWLAAMNSHKDAQDVGKFDKLDLFSLLDAKDAGRPEVLYIGFFIKLFKTLNAFTVPIDALFEKVLEMPLLAAEDYTPAYDRIKARLDGESGSEGERLEAFLKKEHEVVDELRAHLPGEFGGATDQSAYDQARHVVMAIADEVRQGGLRDAASGGDQWRPPSIGSVLLNQLGISAEDDVGLENSPSFFHPLFARNFGAFLAPAKADRGRFSTVGATSVPADAMATLSCISRLYSGEGDPLGCDAFAELWHVLSRDEQYELMQATNKRWLAYDHVELVVNLADGIKAMYIARGRPDLWQKGTKPDHRRVIKPGVWVCRTPSDGSNEAWWDARRQIAMVHSVSGADKVFGDAFDDSTGKVKTERCVLAHVYTDLQAARAQAAVIGRQGGSGESLCSQSQGAKSVGAYQPPCRASGYAAESTSTRDGVMKVGLTHLQLLNQHLGKAGGLNFGLEALMRTDGVLKPNPSRPMFFAIIDARHACDERYWMYVMPTFFEHDQEADHVFFNMKVALCQVPHSYIGMSGANDKLDMANNFFFSGMALMRDRSAGVTSAGTGGTWSICSSHNLIDYFFGRTMIEDTTSTHKAFLLGFRSRYVPPLQGDVPLMRAVPKVSANYLEALERWDTGAVQSLVSQGLPRRWFWATLFVLLTIVAAMMLPAFTAHQGLQEIFDNPLDARYRVSFALLLTSMVVFATVLIAFVALATIDPDALNWCLRFFVFFFNVTYPITSVFGLFWLALPPYIGLTGRFPFSFDAINTLVGSLILKMFDFLIVGKMQRDSMLGEDALTMVQKMDKVLVPIKIRAILKGFTTGWDDVVLKHDNSFWISFGAAAAPKWVRIWLVLFLFTMTFTLIVAFGRCMYILIVSWPPVNFLSESGALESLFALVSVSSLLWLAYDPARFVLKGEWFKMKLPPRWFELGLLIAILAGFLYLRQQNIDVENAAN